MMALPSMANILNDHLVYDEPGGTFLPLDPDDPTLQKEMLIIVTLSL